ncbi:hypothetical protein HNO88_004182 [Novosphingobium chloroacetimidivorans]|uniref:Uncharacterized protein n=1 Tax=Novosphingobium chloroacetimidivorans TaxID=1428314 RepID=A0A7W7KDJ2_9SPHN|nr:hypothetical protein [Novosphingobium chloroacetimidivorans]MBB4860837.1 hypothetical protein [Novosphingobium chloroacetimidivorans]
MPLGARLVTVARSRRTRPSGASCRLDPRQYHLDQAAQIQRDEFEALVELDTHWNIEITGFSTVEIDLLLDMSLAEAKLEEQPNLDRREVSGVECGDLWILESHRLLCGESRDIAWFQRLMRRWLVL